MKLKLKANIRTAAEEWRKKYDKVGFFQEEGLARVTLNGKYGFINEEGEEVIPPKYDEAYPFRKGLAAVELNGKSGWINPEGTVVIPLKYDNAGNFSEGLAEVKLNGKWGLVNTKGEEVVPPEYTSIEEARKQMKS